MSTRVAVFNHGRIEQIGTPTRDLRAARDRVRRRLRRHVEHRRARRAPPLPPARADRASPTAASRATRRRRRLRRRVHALRRRHRPGRAARRPTAERRLHARARHAGQPRLARRGRIPASENDDPQEDHDEQAHVGGTPRPRRRARVPGRGRHEERRGGTLNMIAWEGYTQPQWVKPFEKQTGCKVNAKYAGSSDEMVTLMRSGGGGQYDMVSASGDASLRLIYGKDVQAVDPSKIPDYKNFTKTFQSPPNNTVDGKHYGISLQWGPNTLLYNTQKVKPAPTSWSPIYSSKYKGKVTVPDNPIQIADAALYLMKTQAGARDQGPVRAERGPVRRGDRPAEAAEAADQEVLGARLRRDRPVQERRRRDRRVLAVPDEHAPGREGAGEGPRPEGGRDRLARHVDGVVEDEEPRLRLQVAGVDLDAEGAGAAGRLLRRDAGEQAGLQGDGQDRQGLVREVPRRRAARRTSGRSTSGRRRSPTAATARRTAWTTRSGSRPGPSSRAERAVAARSAPPASAARSGAAPWLQGRSRVLRAAASAAFVAVYIAALGGALRLGVLDGRLVHGPARPPLDDSTTSRRSGTTRSTATSRCGRSRSPRGDDRRRRDRVPVRVLHGPRRRGRARARRCSCSCCCRSGRRTSRASTRGG